MGAGQVAAEARAKVVQHAHPPALRCQRFHQMRPDKARAAGHQTEFAHGQNPRVKGMDLTRIASLRRCGGWFSLRSGRVPSFKESMEPHVSAARDGTSYQLDVSTRD